MNKDLATRFKRIVWAYYKKHGRHDLPWRKTHNPYRILVSEVMLQQTQVERVIPYYRAWMKQFPTVHALAKASLADVLRAWQGLGYNRRAKMLHEASKILAQRKYFPKDMHSLEVLPGIGPYTARAVMAFAYNADVVCVETNIRTVITHHFFARKKSVTDAEVLRTLEQVLPKGKSRAWHAALMDYGAYLKRTGVRINAKVKGYTKQSLFKGSDREARGAILRLLAHAPTTRHTVQDILGKKRRAQVTVQLTTLTDEGFVEYHNRRFQLSST